MKQHFLNEELKTCIPTKNSTQLIDNQNNIIIAQAMVRNKNRNVFGTIGGYMKERDDVLERIYGLTCLHSVKENTSDWTHFIGEESKEIFDKTDLIGELGEKIFNESLDVAFIEILNTEGIDNNHIENPTGIYTPTSADNDILEVKLFSEKQEKLIFGILRETDIKEPQTVYFGEFGKRSDFVGLMSFSNIEKTDRLTEAGDSGAWIRRKDNNKVIGMVIGATKDKTYAIKISKILDFFPNYILLDAPA